MATGPKLSSKPTLNQDSEAQMSQSDLNDLEQSIQEIDAATEREMGQMDNLDAELDQAEFDTSDEGWGADVLDNLDRTPVVSDELRAGAQGVGQLTEAEAVALAASQRPGEMRATDRKITDRAIYPDRPTVQTPSKKTPPSIQRPSKKVE